MATTVDYEAHLSNEELTDGLELASALAEALSNSKTQDAERISAEFIQGYCDPMRLVTIECPLAMADWGNICRLTSRAIDHLVTNELEFAISNCKAFLDGAGGSIDYAIHECAIAISNLLPFNTPDSESNQLLEEADDKQFKTAVLLTTYCSIVEQGYLDAGADIFASTLCEHNGIIASSNARLIVEVSAAVLESIFANAEDPPKCGFSRFDPWSFFSFVNKLSNVGNSEITASTERIVTRDELRRISGRFDVEYEILAQSSPNVSPGVVAHVASRKPNVDTEDHQRRQRGIELRKSGKGWRSITEDLEQMSSGEATGSDIARIKAEVKRFAVSTGQELPEGRSGRPSIKNKPN